MGKISYKVKNWNAYNQYLRDRGSLTLLFSEDLIASWKPQKNPNKRGRPVEYSNEAIMFCHSIRAILSLPLRQCQGFIQSLFKLTKLELSTPDYTELSKRVKKMELPTISTTKEVRYIAIDSSGLKIYGEGEWKVRQHGKEKRRTWRKVHISVDPETKEIVAAVVSEANIHDSEKTKELLSPLDSVGTVYGDGAYDTQSSYEAVLEKGGIGVFPPRKNAALGDLNEETNKETQRDTNILSRDFLGDKEWKTLVGYGRRSLSENVFFRFKTIFGPKLRSRKIVQQAFEVALKIKLLNQFTAIGLPISIPAL